QCDCQTEPAGFEAAHPGRVGEAMDSGEQPSSAILDRGASRLERPLAKASGFEGSFARADTSVAHAAPEAEAWHGRAPLSVDPVRRSRDRTGMAQAEVALRRRGAKPCCLQSSELSSFWRSYSRRLSRLARG